MSVVYLVRHGQASFGAEDYDQLSEKGHAQSRLLGAALRERIPEVHLVVTGSQRRHRETADDCLGEMGDAARAPRRELGGFDEFDHDELLVRLEPRYEDKEQLALDILSAGEPRKAFQAIFTKAVARWTSGAHDDEYTESWPQFRRRCLEALDEVTASLGPKETALVFTSGGPITAICEELLRIPDEDAFRVSWTLVNCGVTKVLHRPQGLVLSTVNEHGHFEGTRSEFITYR